MHDVCLPQVQHGKSKVSSLEQEVETERQKADSLAALMDKERHQQLTLQQQELAATKQLRHDLTQAKVCSCGQGMRVNLRGRILQGL